MRSIRFCSLSLSLPPSPYPPLSGSLPLYLFVCLSISSLCLCLVDLRSSLLHLSSTAGSHLCTHFATPLTTRHTQAHTRTNTEREREREIYIYTRPLKIHSCSVSKPPLPNFQELSYFQISTGTAPSSRFPNYQIYRFPAPRL